MTESIAIGVDIGGTKIAIAAASRDGRILSQDIVPTHPAEGVDSVVGRLARAIENVIDGVGSRTRVAGIGVAAPGPVDPQNGIALNAVNLGWRDVPLRDLLRAKLAITAPIALANDVNAGALGEMRFGAARGVRDFGYLVVGTGLGGGAVLDGRIVNGAKGAAMEVGHVSIDLNGRRCTCGLRGCVEMYVSGKGVLAAVAEYLADYPGSPLTRLDPITTGAIFQAAREGDPLAVRVMAEAADALGVALAWTATILNPPLIVIGGGFAQAAEDRLWDGALASLRARALPAVVDALTIVRSQIESTALGASALVWGGMD
jgi:glucokinase